MLWAILNRFWKQLPTKQQLYNHSLPITKTVQVRPTRHVGHCWRSKDQLVSDVLHWTLTLADQQESIYNSSMRTLDGVRKTCRERCMIEIDREREKESRKSVLAERLDDDDDCLSTRINNPRRLIYLSSSSSSSCCAASTDIPDRLLIIWKSDLTDKMKSSFFQAAVVSILLYGCTTCTLTKRLEKKLDGNYTRILQAILNKSWRQHPTRHQLYGHLPPITKIIQVRPTRHAGHCWRSRDELSDVLLWIYL